MIQDGGIALSAPFWLSRKQSAELEKKASDGDAAAAFELHKHYRFTTDDRSSAQKWLKVAAKRGHETARFNLAVETGQTDCAAAKAQLRKIARESKSAETRRSAAGWVEDAQLCLKRRSQ